MANIVWKISRRGNTQLPLVIVLALSVVLVLLGKAQSSLFDRARMRLTDWMAPALSLVHEPVNIFNRWTASADDALRVYQENLALKDENGRLKQWRTAAIVAQGQVKRYQDLLHAVPNPDTKSVLAHVIGRANRPFLQTMILDAGSAQGVKPGEAVVDSRGMIGRTYLSGDHTSWVILLSDLNSRVPVSVVSANGKNNSAIMTGDNSAMPVLDTLSQIVTLNDGDQVISSGDGGLLPTGLPIGTVVHSAGGYRVALLADPRSSEDVEILAFRNAPEGLPLASRSQLPAVAAGLPPAPPPPAAPTVTLAVTPAAPKSPARAAAPTVKTRQAGNQTAGGTVLAPAEDR